MVIKNPKIGCFYKESDKIIFLIKQPFTNQKIKETNLLEYNYFNISEILDNSLLIGYSFDLKGNDYISAANFIAINKNKVENPNPCLLYINKNIIVYEDSSAKSALIIGRINNG